jgi:hypothetical protein
MWCVAADVNYHSFCHVRQVPEDLPADTFTQYLKAGASLDTPDIWSRNVAPIIVARFALLRDDIPHSKVRF